MQMPEGRDGHLPVSESSWSIQYHHYSTMIYRIWLPVDVDIVLGLHMVSDEARVRKASIEVHVARRQCWLLTSDWP